MSRVLSSFKGIKGASGLQINRVLRKSDGAVLWKRSSPYYAIQSGKIVNCPNASAWAGGSLAVTTGECSYAGFDFYGGNSHVAGAGNNSHYWGADTGNMDSKGCSKLRVKPHVYTSDYTGGYNATLTIYGDGAVIATFTIGWNSNSSVEKTIDIRAYNTVRVHINVLVSEEASCYPSCGLVDVQFHD